MLPISAELPRAELFRLLGDEDRLRLLALCAEEELTVSELATLLHESQPQITRKSQPLRDAGLLHARRDGNRTLLRAHPSDDVVVRHALHAGHALCLADQSLARIPLLLAEREAHARTLFESAPSDATTPPVDGGGLAFLPLFAPLLRARGLAVDAGTGEGALLPILSGLFARVIAVDRSAARLARCAQRVHAHALPNVRLHEGDVSDASLQQDVSRRGGADAVVLSRVLHHVGRPQELVQHAARLLAPGGHLLVLEHLPHDDESWRARGHVWLGLAPDVVAGFCSAAGLVVDHRAPWPGAAPADAEDRALAWHLVIARKPNTVTLVQ